jgi:hypothetical protein
VTGLYSGSATYASGDQFTIIFPNANTGTTPTINISSEGAKTIVDNKGDPVSVGDVEGILKLAYDGTNFRIVGGTGSGGGGGTVTDVLGTTSRITSSGGATPVIDISATFEALLGKRAERIDQNNAATTSAQLATTLSDETGSSGGFTRTDYVDGKIAASITNGVTTSAPNQDQVFDALAAKLSSAMSESTGTTIEFIENRRYNETGTPATGNITINTTGAQLGKVIIVVHEDASEPTYGTGATLKAGEYLAGEVNYLWYFMMDTGEFHVRITH